MSSFELARHDDLRNQDGTRPDAWSFIQALERIPAGDLEVGDYR